MGSRNQAVSFALKETVKDFAGGSTVVGDKVVNIGRRLKDGGGAITTDDPQEIAAFRGLDVLKEGKPKPKRKRAAARGKKAAATGAAATTSGDSAGGEDK